MPANADRQDKTFRSGIANKLRELAQVLMRHRIVSDVSPLTNAAAFCLNYPKKKKWGYEVNSLVFYKLGGLKLFPHQAKTARLRLDMKIEGFCTVQDGADPLTDLVIEFEISSSLDQENTILHCWHFDRDIEGGNASEFCHPIYHFQFGGNKLEHHLADKPPHILLLDAPRLAHPPMDAVLSVDFVIANFVGLPLAHECIEDTLYRRLVKDAQHELWKSYIDNLHGAWQPNSRALPWKPSLIWPQLVGYEFT